MRDQPRLNRRNVLKTTGGIAAGAALGVFGTNSAAAHEHVRGVRVNQVGYRSEGEKVAVVVTRFADGDEFEVVDANSGETVHSGDLGPEIDDENSNRTVRHADFSEVDEPGEYVVEVGGEASFPFEIGEDVYDDVLRQVGRLYTLKRSGADIDDPETGMQFEAGHLQDANAEVMAHDDPTYDQGDTIDATGGWYDAGDYGKYIPPSAITVGAKLTAYERNEELFEDLDYNYPSGLPDEDVAAGLPDALREIRWKLDWMQQVQRTDGAMWHIIAGTGWPQFHHTPADDDQDRYAFGLSSAGTAMSCAVFAQAAQVFEGYDDSFAETMMDAAEHAWEWLEDNPGMVWRMDQQQDDGSGPYHRGDEFEDPTRYEEHPFYDAEPAGEEMERFDRFWAAAEMLRATGDEYYDQYIADEFDDVHDHKTIDFDWYNGLVLGQRAYYNADAADEGRRQEVADAIVDFAESFSEHIAQDGFNNALTWRDYHWASVQKGASYGCILVLAGEIADEPQYVEDGIEQLHHVLGRSATGFSYMTAIGDYYPENPHDRLVNSTGTLIPGLVVGGPNHAEVWDLPFHPTLSGDAIGYTAGESPHEDPGHAHMYDDVQGDFEVNEWAINYTAPVFWLLAEAAGDLDTDGGSGGSCPEGAGEETLSNGNTVCDLDGDGNYRDLTASGDTTTQDLQYFFENQHKDPYNSRTDLFDFTDNGNVGQPDVVDLFHAI